MVSYAGGAAEILGGICPPAPPAPPLALNPGIYGRVLLVETLSHAVAIFRIIMYACSHSVLLIHVH